MSTIKRNIEENLDEIVFAQRNKDYGAYELRKRYKKNVIKALSFSFFLLLVITITPLIMAFTGYNSNIFIPDITEYGFTEVTETETVTPPEAPPPVKTVEVQKYKYTAYEIVDTTILDIELPSNEEIASTEINEEFTDVPIETNEAIKENNDPIEIWGVQEKPEFPGGEQAMFEWLSKNIKFPEKAIENDGFGKVFVQFVINKEGKVTNIELLNSVDPYLDEEAKRVVGAMPDWSPGKNNGRPVSVYFKLPIKFTLCNR